LKGDGRLLKRHAGKLICIYLGLYFIANLLFLDKFPFMHSDESWLSGLTRAMMSNGLNSTEPFFDLLPRFPHAIKILFHIMQMPFILIFGYNIFSVRLVSLVFGVACLYLFYRLSLCFLKTDIKAFMITVVLSLDVQFIYASHFARQEVIIASGILAVLYYIIRSADAWRVKKDLTAGIITGLFIGIHPNSLIIAMCGGALYFYFIFNRKIRVKNLLIYTGTVALMAAVFAGISFLFDGNFITHYSMYGSTMGVDQPLFDKIKELPLYYIKLFEQVSGTYYTPPIQFQLIIFAVGAAASAVLSVFKKETLQILLPILAVNAGIILIGRYSQPAVLFLFPLCYLVLFFALDSAIKKFSFIPAILIGVAVFVHSVISVTPCLNNSYKEYLAKIRTAVPPGSRVLANLNAEYAFENGYLLDYRNLEYLEAAGISFKEYIYSRGIEYIVYPEEMDFIYESRPVWNIMYGNLYPYYGDMTRFFSSSCKQLNVFSSPYAMRIVQFSANQDWKLRIYRVESEDADGNSF